MPRTEFRFRCLLTSSLLCLVMLSTLTSCRPRRELPPILLVTIDTLRADRLGCYGYFRDTTPNLDHLAEDALLFERAYAPMATTLPVHVSLLTSTHPSRHGIIGNLKHLKQPLTPDSGLRTWAQMLDDLGYATAAFVSATPLKADSGIAIGFDHFDQPRWSNRRANTVVRKALHWLEEKPGGPFFLWLHLWDPHFPYRAPEGNREVFSQGAGELEDYLRERGFGEPASPETRLRNVNYDEEVRFVDRELGRLLEKLRALGLYDGLTIVVTADHGEGLGQHDWTGHGHLWNEQLHVPLLIKLPASFKIRGRREDPVSLVDLLPTLVEALDLPLSSRDREQLDGRAMLRRPRGERYVLSERSRREFFTGGVRYTLTGPRWKYHRLTEGPDELYDLASDPHELHDVLADYPQVAGRLEAMILERIADHRRRADATASDDLTEQRLEELRSLGYVD